MLVPITISMLGLLRPVPLMAQPSAANPLGDVLPMSPANAESSAEASRALRATRPALAGPVDPRFYRLGPGDALSLEYGGKASGSLPMVVDAEGRIRIPNLGLVRVGGMLLQEAREDIVRRLKPFLPGATMDLRLIQPRTFKVYVLGEVKFPGVESVTGSARVAEAVEAAGGATSGGSLRNLHVLHADGRETVADLGRFGALGDLDGNPYLEDGDRIVVPAIVARVSVFGSVARPNLFEYRSGDSLSTLLRLAGGALPEARLDSAVVIRFLGANQLDTLAVDLRPGGPDLGRLAQPDDRLFVRGEPQWRPAREVTISGEIKYPGTYAIIEGRDRVSDLLGWAGGFTPLAARRNVRIERRPEDAKDDPEFDHLSRLNRSEMTNSEYQGFKSKLALRQSSYLIDFSHGTSPHPDQDVLLRDGDHVAVERLQQSVRVDGSVKEPGLFQYATGRSVEDYIRLAGGTTTHANSSDARLTRAGSSSTLQAHDVRVVEPGDFIWVPEKKEVSTWSVFKDIMIVAGQAAAVILLVDNLSHHNN
jgi:protein involved in polysaccharide export with SLBB domain